MVQIKKNIDLNAPDNLPYFAYTPETGTQCYHARPRVLVRMQHQYCRWEIRWKDLAWIFAYFLQPVFITVYQDALK